jgi:hypothetical protein
MIRMADECLRCGEDGQPVPLALVRHHLTEPWRRDIEGREFSICEEPGCAVVYFASDGQAFEASDLRRPPAYKSGTPGDLLCFCFDVTGEAALGPVDPTPYVRERVRKGECACDVLNPSGTCCLGSIGRWRKDQGS